MLSALVGMSADTFPRAIFSCDFLLSYTRARGVSVELATINIFFRGHWNEKRQGNKFRDNIVGVSDTVLCCSSFRILLLFPRCHLFSSSSSFLLFPPLCFHFLFIASFLSLPFSIFLFSSYPLVLFPPFCCFQSRASICFLILRFRIRATMIYRSPPREKRGCWHGNFRVRLSRVTLLFIPLSSFPRYIVFPAILSLYSNRVSPLNPCTAD